MVPLTCHLYLVIHYAIFRYFLISVSPADNLMQFNREQKDASDSYSPESVLVLCIKPIAFDRAKENYHQNSRLCKRTNVRLKKVCSFTHEHLS